VAGTIGGGAAGALAGAAEGAVLGLAAANVAEQLGEAGAAALIRLPPKISKALEVAGTVIGILTGNPPPRPPENPEPPREEQVAPPPPPRDPPFRLPRN
jgi:phage tail tape-measure protein